MKKSLLLLIVLLISPSSVSAEKISVTIGNASFEIPPPVDFVHVTEEMAEVYQYCQFLNRVDLKYQQLAYYIPKSEEAVALQGELPSLEKSFVVQRNKNLKEGSIGPAEFQTLKRETEKQFRQIKQDLESQSPGIYEKLNKGFNNRLDLKKVVNVAELIPLEPHYETSNTFAFSMYIKLDINPKDQFIETDLTAGTASILNIKGKLLFLYCYAPKEELAWTRMASKKWSEAVHAANDKSPIRSTYKSRTKKSQEGDEFARLGLIILVILAALAIFIKKHRISAR